MVDALFAGLGDGVRVGPIVVGVEDAPHRAATLTAIRLQQNQGAISCALARAGARRPTAPLDREAFAGRAVELLAGASQDLELAIVQLDAPSSDGPQLEAMVVGALRAQAYLGEPPTALGPGRYAFLRGRDEPTGVMSDRLAQVLADIGVETVPQVAAMPLAGALRPRQVMQALKF